MSNINQMEDIINKNKPFIAGYPEKWNDKKIRFGKYKGQKWINLPHSYLEWLLDNSIPSKKQTIHIKEILNIPKEKYIVTITDSINQDGKYLVLAHDEEQAWKCVSNKVKCTQSHYGTSFSTELLLVNN